MKTYHKPLHKIIEFYIIIIGCIFLPLAIVELFVTKYPLTAIMHLAAALVYISVCIKLTRLLNYIELDDTRLIIKNSFWKKQSSYNFSDIKNIEFTINNKGANLLHISTGSGIKEHYVNLVNKNDFDCIVNKVKTHQIIK